MKKRIFAAALALAMTASIITVCTKTYVPTLPTGPEEADIFVLPVDGLSDDFIKGMDISSLISEEQSGVKYYDQEGNEQDLFKILADSGINYIRVRVWNNPYDQDGNGYGGGNCNVDTAAELGKRASAYGMKLLVDFHYSDFWADPNKQYTPVEWRRKPVDEKSELLYNFTVSSLRKIKRAGADIGMVQIGNEINNGLSGEYSVPDIMTLLDSASRAVRSVDSNIKIAVHYTEIDDTAGTIKHARDLQNAGIDYDIFGVSYYPYWHGSLENMTSVLSQITEAFGKETCILETSYLYTGDDGDQFGNSVSGDDTVEGYPASVQGQASMIRDVISAANDAGSIGVFYWEGAWIPVGSDYDSNKALWEEFGSGWASSYSTAYDPQDAGKYYGGCSWDNQAFFDFEGHVLPSLDVFKYVNYGATAPLEVMAYKDVYIESGIGEELVMPETIEAFYNDPTVTDGVAVDWDESQVEAVDIHTAATYEVDGTTADGTVITARIKVANINYISNPSFEDPDMSMWEIIDNGSGDSTDRQTKAGDALTGENALHFWSTSDINFDVQQTFDSLPSGVYAAVANLQGGDAGASDVYVYIRVNDDEYTSDNIPLEGWQHWQIGEVHDVTIPEGASVTVGVHVSAQAEGWGTIDDLEFYNQNAG